MARRSSRCRPARAGASARRRRRREARPAGCRRPPARHPYARALDGKALHPLGLEIDAGLPAGIEQGGGDVARRDHMREGLVSLHVACEGEKGRPHRILQAAVGDHHVEDGLRPVRDLRPDAERLQHPARGGGDGIGALVPVRIALQRRVAHDHLDAVGERPLERQRQGQTGKAAAGDDDARLRQGSRFPLCCAHRSFSMTRPSALEWSTLERYRWVSAIHRPASSLTFLHLSPMDDSIPSKDLAKDF